MGYFICVSNRLQEYVRIASMDMAGSIVRFVPTDSSEMLSMQRIVGNVHARNVELHIVTERMVNVTAYLMSLESFAILVKLVCH